MPGREAWFDDLCRVVASPMSRRRMLRVLASALGTTFLAGCATGGDAPPAGGGGESGNGSGGESSSTTTTGGCSSPSDCGVGMTCCGGMCIPQKVKPTYNGCGAEGGWIHHDGLVSNVNLTPACNAHDICYDTCNKPKQQCDEEFNATMTQICFGAANPGECLALASAGYAVVQSAGGSAAYSTAQGNVCACG
jgi:hypothetical protein